MIEIRGPLPPGFSSILSQPALRFIASLARRFGPRVAALLDARAAAQEAIDGGELPDFLPQTREMREAAWQVCIAPADLVDRTVEIVGPAERGSIVSALNSGARVFMADFEDSLAPTWQNVIQGQVDLRDAIDGSIGLEANGKRHTLHEAATTLIVRPRGWHLAEPHMLLEGIPVPAALVDFGLFLFHNAANLKQQGSGPYFYLPKLESHLEARLWAEVFRAAEEAGVVERDAIRVTVLIETIVAAFAMDEILHELRHYIVGLTCGRRDYLFSVIKTFSRYPEFILPDREALTMKTHFLRSFSKLLIHVCHRRGASAIGDLAAQVPIRGDREADGRAMAGVRADKQREVLDGHDGTRVAHPGYVPLAREVFSRHVAGRRRLECAGNDIDVSAGDLLQVVRGRITEGGLRENIHIALKYLASWLGGNGWVPIHNQMAEAATAEIARAQLWQWTHHATGVLDEGRNITLELFSKLLDEELVKVRAGIPDGACADVERAAALLAQLTSSDALVPFMTAAACKDIG